MKIPAFSERPEGLHTRENFLTQAGATRLAQRIEAVWAAHGHPQVRCAIRKARFHSKHCEHGQTEHYVVISNLVGGLPPRPRFEDAA